MDLMEGRFGEIWFGSTAAPHTWDGQVEMSRFGPEGRPRRRPKIVRGGPWEKGERQAGRCSGDRTRTSPGSSLGRLISPVGWCVRSNPARRQTPYLFPLVERRLPLCRRAASLGLPFPLLGRPPTDRDLLVCPSALASGRIPCCLADSSAFAGKPAASLHAADGALVPAQSRLDCCKA